MGKKCVAWVLALVLALCGCSAGGGNSVPAGESAHSSAVEAAAQPTASPAPEPVPATVEGKVARASKSAFELRLWSFFTGQFPWETRYSRTISS